MNRFIFGGALASVVFLIVGTYVFPTSMIMWFASLSIPYTVFRFLMVGLLLAVLFTEPPRRAAVRALMGGLAVLLVAWGVALSVGDSMHMLDIIIFFQLAFVFGIEALELSEEEVDAQIVRIQHPEEYEPAPSVVWPFVVRQAHHLQTHLAHFQAANDRWQVV